MTDDRQPVEPIILGEDYGATYHQTSVDPFSGQARVMQSAHCTGMTAMIFGTFKQLQVGASELQLFWSDFKDALRSRGVVEAYGWVPRHLATHHVEVYGLRPTGKERQSEAGVMVELHIVLQERDAAHAKK